MVQPWRAFSPSQEDPGELGTGGDLAERLQETDGPGHSKGTETLPAQVGVPAPEVPEPRSISKAAAGTPALCKPKDKTLELQKRGGQGAQESSSVHPGTCRR